MYQVQINSADMELATTPATALAAINAVYPGDGPIETIEPEDATCGLWLVELPEWAASWLVNEGFIDHKSPAGDAVIAEFPV